MDWGAEGLLDADIVGFTALGEEVAEVELTDIAERFEALAAEHVRAPVRVVKTIGDAVMVVSRDAVARLGDWFGPTVNLAARLTQRARPDSILVSVAVRDVLPEDVRARYGFSEAGHKRLKGISDPVPTLRLRRAADAA